jgi:hypothetical protein
MAVALGFRIAIVVAGVGTRVVKWSEGPGVDAGSQLSQALLQRLADPAESNADLSQAVSDAVGYAANVANYSDPFELRKLQVRWGRGGGAAVAADDAITTHHFLKLAGGAPSATWVAADFEAAEAAFDGFWFAISDRYDASTSLKQYRWYKAGPAVAPPQSPVRIVDRTTTGAVISGAPCPPQVAISVTEKTTFPANWGRFYLPAPNTGQAVGLTGRITSATQTDVADAADVMYEAFVTASIPAVVYSAAKGSRPSAGGGTLPAIGARALGVAQLQVDDLFDVIRSRRWNEPLLRLQRDVAGA